MAPGGGGKRKRGDRTFSQDSRDEGSRPSPHRPGNLNLAKQSTSSQSPQQQNFNQEQHEQRGGGRRRASRGGRGGVGPQRSSPMNSPNTMPLNSRITTPVKPSSPPPPSVASPHTIDTQQPQQTSETATQTVEELAAAVPYQYTLVTEDNLRRWNQTGKQNVIRAGADARKAQDSIGLISIFQELVRSGLDGRLDSLDAGSVVKDILEQDVGHTHADESGDTASFDPSALLLDCLSILAESSPNMAKLTQFVQATEVSALRMRLELGDEFLKQLGMVRNTFDRVGIRKQTNLIYRQSNYNLLREETEGFSKLITELFTTSSNETLTPELVEETFEHVKGMIGAFDMDVGRVLDVTLDVFAAVLVKQYRFFVKLFRTSSWWPEPSSFEKTSSQLVSDPLPRWALPGAQCHSYDMDERVEIAHARDERDRQFWLRANDVGMIAFFEIVGRRVEGSVSVALETLVQQQAAYKGDSALETIPQIEVERRWIEATGTLPAKGNYMAAQILGFKLRFYSSSARGPADVLPVNLIYLAALLIKIGFISLVDLYPHLWPADDAMEDVREVKLKEKAEKEKLNRPGGGALNALASAGALPDDIPSIPVGRLRDAERMREAEESRKTPLAPDATADKAAPKSGVDAEEELPEPADQKVQLLKSLLCIGALPEALYILGRFPWLPDAFTELPEYIHRILHHSLSKVYDPLRPLPDHPLLKEQQRALDSDQSGTIKGNLKYVEPAPRKTLRWAQLDKEDTNEGIDYRFYWDDWSDMIPVCQSVDDVFLLCKTLLNYSGVKIGQDPVLLMKLTRIGKHSLSVDPSESNRSRWFDLLKRVIVPSLSMTRSNPGIVNEVFELLKSYPTMERYAIYAEWYQGPTSRLPEMKSAFDQVKAETKDVLKRISKTNVRPMARALARVATASPGIVFQVAISQIESYDNLVDTVSECARYFTYLSYDVLTWSLISSLGAQGRLRVQADGMLTSKWLQAIALFSGKVFKRYAVMNPVPVLNYVIEQLRHSNPTDLIVLEQMTSNMAGIVSDTNFNEAQVLAMAGGDLLQAQTMLQLHDTRHELRSPAKRLIRALTGSRLAGQLLVAIAQERQTCVFKFPEQNAPLKVLGNQFDELHRIFVQYLDLLRSNLSAQDFEDLVPSVSRLIIEFGLEPNIAFYITRPGIAAAISAYDKAAAKSAAELKRSPVQGPKESKEDAIMVDGQTKTEDITNGEISSITEEGPGQDPAVVKSASLDDSETMEIDGKDSKADSAPISSPSAVAESSPQPWHPVLQDLMDTIQPALPSNIWEVLSRSFFVTFWSMSLCDMHVPTQSYDDEINRQKKKIVAINSDRSDLTKTGSEKKEKEKKALNDLQDRLRAELKDQVQTYSLTRARLQKEKEVWFAEFWGKWEPLNASILEQCFLPRLTLSPVDALYVFKLFKYLHSSGAGNFRSMGLLDQLFNEKRLTLVLFFCTAKEAENFGRFLSEVLRDLGRWHADKSIFEKEAYGPKKDLPGFAKRLDMDPTKKPVEFLSYEEFRRIMLKWHRNLHLALKTSFASGEYMHIRNAINVQKAIYQYFPVVNYMGIQQVASITQLSKNEAREDLKIAATSLLGNLKRREKDWILPQAFNLNEIPMSGSGTNGQRGTSAKPTTPQPDGETQKSLNPRAADFQPSARLSTDGTSELSTTTLNQAQIDAEDGEIDDAKMKDAPQPNFTADSKEPGSQEVKAKEDLLTEPTKATHIQPAGDSSSTKDVSRSQTPNQANTESEVPLKPLVPVPPAVTSSAQANTIQSSDSPRPASVPGRTELSRNNSVNGRLPHTLPSKPEPAFARGPDNRMPDRLNHMRDARSFDRNGHDRPRDLMYESPAERHGSGSQLRNHEHSAERFYNQDRNRPSPGWGGEHSAGRLPEDNRQGLPHNRESRPLPREERHEWTQRDRPFGDQVNATRAPESQGPPTRDQVMAPPRSNIPQHPDRAALIQNGQDRDNAHFNSPHSDRRSEGSRYDRHSYSDRSSRGPSPPRVEDRRTPRQDGRHEDRLPSDLRQTPKDPSYDHSARYDGANLPIGPRTDRSGAQDRFREQSRNVPNPPSAGETNRRFNQEPNYNNRQQESQYGRLTQGPELSVNRLSSGADVPSGPRLPNGNNPPAVRANGRGFSGAHSQPSPQQTHHPAATPPGVNPGPERQTPTGPSAQNTPRNSLSMPPRLDTAQSTQSPATESPDTAGVHPDRLKAIQGAVKGAPGNTPPSPNTIGRPPRPSLPPVSVPPLMANRPAHGQIPGSAGPNMSPAGPMSATMGPSPTGRGPPTGPSSINDRSRGDRRMFAGLQTVLQQAGTPNAPERLGQGTSIRGRGGRMNNMPTHPPTIPGPPTPSMSRPEQPRGDLTANRVGGQPPSAAMEEDGAYGRGVRRGPPRDIIRDYPRETVRDSERDMTRDHDRERDHMRDEIREGERPSGRLRSSRDHSREPGHGPQMPFRDEDRQRRDDGRDRGSGRQAMPQPTEREMRRPPRGEEQRRTEPDRRDLEGWGQERRGGMDRRDERDRREVGSGRKRGRAGDDGRVHDDKRQRRVN